MLRLVAVLHATHVPYVHTTNLQMNICRTSAVVPWYGLATEVQAGHEAIIVADSLLLASPWQVVATAWKRTLQSLETRCRLMYPCLVAGAFYRIARWRPFSSERYAGVDSVLNVCVNDEPREDVDVVFEA